MQLKLFCQTRDPDPFIIHLINLENIWRGQIKHKNIFNPLANMISCLMNFNLKATTFLKQ